MSDRFRLAQWRRAAAEPRGVIVGGAILILLALLLNSAGLAIFIAALVVPIAVLIDLSRRDLFEIEPWWSVLAMGATGAVAAIFISLFNVFLLKQFESETDPSKQCCGVFLGRVNLDFGSTGAASMIFIGFFLPLVAEALKIAGPLYLRQQPRFRNEVMDGLTLGAAAGGGYAAAAAILYFWPLVNDSPSLGGSVSGWTSALIALLIVRPLISCVATGLIGAGIWHYSLSPRLGNLIIPAGSAIIGSLILAVGSLAIADQPTVVELIWNVVVVLALLAACRYVLSIALGYDSRQISTSVDTDRIVCPVCGALTKRGTFCSNCGAPLTIPVPVEAAAPEPVPSEPWSPATTTTTTTPAPFESAEETAPIPIPPAEPSTASPFWPTGPNEKTSPPS
jgi:RsiW-degrading membrane proteinase PrsW (M82 family)